MRGRKKREPYYNAVPLCGWGENAEESVVLLLRAGRRISGKSAHRIKRLDRGIGSDIVADLRRIGRKNKSSAARRVSSGGKAGKNPPRFDGVQAGHSPRSRPKPASAGGTKWGGST